MTTLQRLALPALIATAFTAGCATVSLEQPAKAPPPAAAAAPVSTAGTPGPGETRIVRSTNGTFHGEIVGVAAPGSRFAQLQIGMEWQPVQQLIGPADNMFSHDTGKQWIPFYFGNDARRVVAHYKGEGCLTFTGGNAVGAKGNELIRIEVDPSGRCYKP